MNSIRLLFDYLIKIHLRFTGLFYTYLLLCLLTMQGFIHNFLSPIFAIDWFINNFFIDWSYLFMCWYKCQIIEKLFVFYIHRTCVFFAYSTRCIYSFKRRSSTFVILLLLQQIDSAIPLIICVYIFQHK